MSMKIAHLSLGGCDQSCPGMPKETFETYLENNMTTKIYFNSRGQSCYLYIEGDHSVVINLLLHFSGL